MAPFSLVLATLVQLAQDPSPLPAVVPTPPPPILLSSAFHGVHVDLSPASDGRYWARGDRYKMSFGTDGAAFLPLFSSRAPRHWPLQFRLPGRVEVTPVVHETGAVLAAEGFPIEEHWDLRPDGAEQSFVLKQAPRDGVLVVELHGDLPYGGSDDRGHHFVVEGFGEVVYGHAFAVGDDGGKTPLRSTFAMGSVHIELPADAVYPLVVDPFVATIGVASNQTFDNRDPDVAFDATSGRWAVVMTERVSTFDTDLKVRRFDANGVLLDTDYLESGGAVVGKPSIAVATRPGTSSLFCVAWEEAGFDIKSRLLSATATVPGTTLLLYPGVPLGGLRGIRPDVGGSRDGSFLVVYVTEGPVAVPELEARLIGGDGSVQPRDVLASLTGCITPRIADMRPGFDHWPIAWSDQATGCVSGDVKFMVVNRNRQVEAPPMVIAGATLDDDRHVDVAWNGAQGMIVWDRDMGSHHDVFGQAFTRTAGGYQTVGSVRNLTAIEPGVTVSGDQQQPVIATDGARFGVSYLEGANRNPICATFAIVNGAIVCHEGHVPVATAAIQHDDHAIAAMGTSGGPTTRYFVVTDERDGANDYDVQGLFYDGRQPGTFFATTATGCTPAGAGAVEPTLVATGGSDVGNQFALQMSGHVGVPFVLAGFPQDPVTTLCTFLVTRRCRQGVQSPFLVTSFGASLAVAVPPSAGLVGLELAFQGLDLLAPGACPSSLFGAAFSVTDTIVATIR